MDASKLKSLAEEHCKGFANANKVIKDIPSLAKELSTYFNSSSFTGFAPTGPQNYTSSSAAERNMEAWLSGLVKLGIDPFEGVSFKDLRVEVLSSRVALCWMTTVFTPPDGEPFGNPLFYSYRVPVGQEKGNWDFMISDSQLEIFQEKYPQFFQAEGAPTDMDGPAVFS